MPEEFRFAKRIEHMKTERETQFFQNFQESLEEELGEITRQDLIGEGQAAKVFNMKTQIKDLPFPLCAKIIRPELEQMSPVEQKKRQYLSPDEEFDLQEKLYLASFPTPATIARFKVGKYNALVMERIIGYSLAQIYDRSGVITEPAWNELDQLIHNLNTAHKVIHRDLHLGNIMLQTEQDIKTERGGLKGKLYIIDFGNSKRIFGPPTEEDYKLTIGHNVIRYTSDSSSVRMLKPRQRGIVGENPFLF